MPRASFHHDPQYGFHVENEAARQRLRRHQVGFIQCASQPSTLRSNAALYDTFE
jgi:hypothetical protein